MKQIMVLMAVVAMLSATAIAQDERMNPQNQNPALDQSQSWQGYLVDAKSAATIAKDPDNAMKKAAEYTRESALAADPAEGFGIFVEGHWLKFDDTGNSQAEDLIKASEQKKGLMIAVTGTLNGDTIAVTSMREISTDAAPQNY
jgi:hypothetical protein